MMRLIASVLFVLFMGTAALIVLPILLQLSMFFFAAFICVFLGMGIYEVMSNAKPAKKTVKKTSAPKAKTEAKAKTAAPKSATKTAEPAKATDNVVLGSQSIENPNRVRRVSFEDDYVPGRYTPRPKKVNAVSTAKVSKVAKDVKFNWGA